MQNTGESDPNACKYNDFALVKLDPRDVSKVDPSVPFWGGPDGLAPTVREAAHVRLSFGAITLPHVLARIVLAEQLYRAATILAGHPYHRA